MNAMKTALLLALLTVVLVAVGGGVAGRQGAELMLLISLGMNFFSYWFSDTIVLKSSGAQQIQRSDAPELYDLVARLAKRAELPMPKLCVVDSEVPNAFATGRNPEHAAVVVTTGILRELDEDELAGVLGHELSHIKHYDILTGSVAAGISGCVSMIGHIVQWGAILGGFGGRGKDDNGGPVGFIFAVIVAPFIATLIQLAVSRSREYEADRSGGELCGNPLALASALVRLDQAAANMKQLQAASNATAHMYIVNPLKDKSFLKSLFSTHPSTEDRVARLKEQAQEMKRLRA